MSENFNVCPRETPTTEWLPSPNLWKPPNQAQERDAQLLELKHFVGSRGDYYLTRWAPCLFGESSRTGFNWAAFLLAGIWFPYRKMYKAGFVLFAILSALTVAEMLLFVGYLEQPEVPAMVQYASGFSVWLLCGILANRLYLSHATRLIAKVRSEGYTEEAVPKAIAKRGGVNLPGALGLYLGFLLASVVTVLTLNSVLVQARFGPSITLNHNDAVFFLGDATEFNARSLGEALTEYGFFGDREGTVVRLSADNREFAISFALWEGTWANPEVADYYRQLGQALAQDLFSAPLTIYLCDSQFKVKKSFTVDPANPQQDQLISSRLSLEELDRDACELNELAQVQCDEDPFESEALMQEAIGLWKSALSQADSEESRKYFTARLATAWLVFGDVQVQCDKHVQAEKALQISISYGKQARELDPGRSLIAHNLQVAHDRIWRLQEQAFAEKLGQFLEQNQYPKARELYVQRVGELRDSMKSPGTDESTALRVAYRLHDFAWFLAHCPDSQVHDPQTAVKLAREAVQLQQDSVEYRFTLAMVEHRAGLWQASLDSISRLKEIQGQSDASDWFLVAMNRHQLKLHGAALRALRKGVETFEQQEREANHDPALRLQFEMARPSLEALYLEAKSLLETQKSDFL